MNTQHLCLRHLGQQPYRPLWQAMQQQVRNRQATSCDEFWFTEHLPVYTVGRRGDPTARRDPRIPLIAVDRGGAITYHGPGQLVVYLLIDLLRKRIGVKQLVDYMEQSVISLLAIYGVAAVADSSRRGVYVDGAKIAALGLRISRGCSSHGMALNVDLDLDPFCAIDPCGYKGLAVTSTHDLGIADSLSSLQEKLGAILADKMGYTKIFTTSHLS